MPDARLRLYPGRTHAGVLTAPGVMDEIAEFLAAD